MKSIVRSSKSSVRIAIFLILAVVISVNAQSQPGGKIIVQSDTSDITVRHVSADAASNDIFGLYSPRTETLWFCLDVDSTYIVDLGRFPIGTELVFFLTNPRPGFEGTFFTGPASRNPDSVVHAVITEVGFQTWLIEWEDWLGGGDFSYDDCVCEIKGNLFISVGVEEKSTIQKPIHSVRLFPGKPNPFSGIIDIVFQLPSPHYVKLNIYDLSGREIKTLYEGLKKFGFHVVQWDGRDERGYKVNSGIYFNRLEARKSPDTISLIMANKIILLR
jgi:hypothetical protein